MTESATANMGNTRKSSTKTSSKKTSTATTAQEREVRRQAAVHLRACGRTGPEIASTLKVSHRTVTVDLTKPKSQEELAALRATARAKMLDSTANGLVDGATALVQKTLDDRDPKGFDAASRGLLNLEKVSSSASGEARKVEVNDTTPGKGATAEDLKELIRLILGREPAAELAEMKAMVLSHPATAPEVRDRPVLQRSN